MFDPENALEFPTHSGNAREVNRELQQVYAQMSLESEFAGRMQACFPVRLPEVGRVRFALHHQGYGPVASDCCDVFRLDEYTVGFWLADTMSHGVPAALLASFLKRTIIGKEIDDCGYRILPPDEVLTRINGELLALKLTEPPLATMIYGTIDCTTGDVSIARAAHPLPIYVPHHGTPTAWPMFGAFLGVNSADFNTFTHTLSPGDRLVLVTDGYCQDPTATHQPHLMETIQATHADQLTTFVDDLSLRLSNGDPAADDRTLVGLEFTG